MNDTLIELENISKDYKQGRSTIEVIKNVNLTVKNNENVAIIGASGSGKSTLLHIIGLLDSQDSGVAKILGNKYINKKDLINSHKVRLNQIGFIYQYHHLLKDFNALENTAMPLIINNVNKDQAFAEAEKLLKNLGLENRLLNVPGELSGGEQQRVAIARALINKPKLILADEPTGNLDPHTAEEVFELFKEYAKNTNSSVVMVSHNIELAKKLDKLYRLDYSLKLE